MGMMAQVMNLDPRKANPLSLGRIKYAFFVKFVIILGLIPIVLKFLELLPEF